MDHFLGKEPVIEIEYLRFANFAMAELWHRTSIESIQITMAENFGVEQRGRFYDAVGAMRDVVQNHLLQVLALVSMDPPIGPSADELRDKKIEVLKAMPPADVHQCVRGQYDGYPKVPGVAPGSDTETFVALRLEIDSWRWAGVPIFIRAGKQMPVRATEVRLLLRHTPRLRFLPDAAVGSWGPPQADALVSGYAPWQPPWLPDPSDARGVSWPIPTRAAVQQRAPGAREANRRAPTRCADHAPGIGRQ